MSINGRREHFTRTDLMAVGDSVGIPGPADITGEMVE